MTHEELQQLQRQREAHYKAIRLERRVSRIKRAERSKERINEIAMDEMESDDEIRGE